MNGVWWRQLLAFVVSGAVTLLIVVPTIVLFFAIGNGEHYLFGWLALPISALAAFGAWRSLGPRLAPDSGTAIAFFAGWVTTFVIGGFFTVFAVLCYYLC